jgi:glycosyltransferase involved in cell wall biosynthesis
MFKRGRIINAIHDLTCWDCPETIPTKMKYYYRYTYGVAAKNSWKLITVSKFSQKRICERYKLSEDKVPVVYDGLTNIFAKGYTYNPDLKNKYSLPNRYMLSLSTLEPRKNLQLLIRAYRDLIEEKKELPDLVLAGRQGWKLEEIVGDVSDSLKDRIHFTGFVDDEDLPQLYADAEVFIFPSKYEGFGLPVIEAMSQKTIVITSDAASLPEVAGTAGIMFSSDDIKALKDTICLFICMDDVEKERRKEQGLTFSHRFSWEMESGKLYKLLQPY